VKEFLSRESVDFEVKDVHSDPVAQEEMMELGYTSIPITVVGDEPPIVGPDLNRIRKALGL